jgi:menaquinone-dependent protoporphyrinogen oxidase
MAILVGYASVFGSTREIAERIASRLTERGLRSEIHPLTALLDGRPFAAFVIGSAIHDGAWLPDAEAFVRDNLATLRTRPTWMFSVGMRRTPALGVLEPLVRNAYPPAISRLREIVRPHGYRYFPGVIYPERLPGDGRLFVKVAGGKFGDFRIWKLIDGWAQSIARALTPVADVVTNG